MLGVIQVQIMKLLYLEHFLTKDLVFTSCRNVPVQRCVQGQQEQCQVFDHSGIKQVQPQA